jgi:hypothetical protein
VITNTPDFPWHQENLKQFTSLPIDQVAPSKRSADEQGASGLDIGRKTNLPGEITSPNRFVRAALYSQYALPFADGQEGVQRVLNILNNFDIPLGCKLYCPGIRFREGRLPGLRRGLRGCARSRAWSRSSRTQRGGTGFGGSWCA